MSDYIHDVYSLCMDTFDDLIAAVQSDLNIDDNSPQFPLATVKLAINRSYRKLSGLFRWPQLEDSEKTSTKEGQEYYDYPYNWRPQSIWRIQVDGTTNDYGDPLPFSDYRYERDNSNPSGLTHYWSNYLKRFYIYPTPTADGTNNIVLFGRTFVDKLESDGDETIFSYQMPDVNEAIVMEAVSILKYKGEAKNVTDLLSPGAFQLAKKSFTEIRNEMAKLEKTQPAFEVPDFFAGTRQRTDRKGNFNI